MWLAVETGRLDDTPLNEQKCNSHTTYYIDDEYHYMFKWDSFLKVTENCILC